jgi:hypothetical protein
MGEDLKAKTLKADIILQPADVGDDNLTVFKFEIVYSLLVWIETFLRRQETPIWFLGLVQFEILQVPLNTLDTRVGLQHFLPLTQLLLGRQACWVLCE